MLTLRHAPRSTRPRAGGQRRAPAENAQAEPAGLLALQRRVGNAAVGRMLVQRHTQGVLDKINLDLLGRRGEMRGHDPTKGDLLAYIRTQVSDIAQLPGMVTVCATKQELIDALAIDLANRAGASSVSEDHRRSAENDVNNGGGGFTAMDGTVYMLESTNDSSALYHELIHVLSAPGGTTQISKTKVNLNEGFTNYFAVELAKTYKKNIFPAYPAATAWVEKFVAKFGRDAAYNVYFKDNEALLYTTLAKQLSTNAEAGKKVLDENKTGGKDSQKPTNLKSTDVGTLFKGTAVKAESELAELIKKKIQASDFLDLKEPNLAWMDRLIFDYK